LKRGMRKIKTTRLSWVSLLMLNLYSLAMIWWPILMKNT